MTDRPHIFNDSFESYESNHGSSPVDRNHCVNNGSRTYKRLSQHPSCQDLSQDPEFAEVPEVVRMAGNDGVIANH